MNCSKAALFCGMALAMTLILQGCKTSGGLITSLEDVSTEAKKEGWKKVPQYRVVSVPGLLPFADVGGLSFYSNLRMATSFVGNDLLGAWPELNEETRYKNRLQLTTHVMQARHILYSAEAELTALTKIKLDASYDELRKISRTLSEIDRIEIGAAIARAQSVSNMGMIGGATRTAVPVDWAKVANGGIANVDGWHTFYGVESYLGDLLDMSRASPDAEPQACQRQNSHALTG